MAKSATSHADTVTIPADMVLSTDAGNVRLGDLSESGIAHILQYGITQSVRDAAASPGAKVRGILDSLHEGKEVSDTMRKYVNDWRARIGTDRPALSDDEELTMLKGVALDVLRARAKAAGEELSASQTKKAVEALVAARHPVVMEAAANRREDYAIVKAVEALAKADRLADIKSGTVGETKAREPSGAVSAALGKLGF